MTQPESVQDVYLVGKSRVRGDVLIDGPTIVWKAKYGDRSVAIRSADVEDLKWTPLREGYELAVTMRTGPLVKLHGFDESNLEDLHVFAALEPGRAITEVKISTNGWNWGDCDIRENGMVFMVEGDQAFEIPFADVAQSARAGKRDVSLEMHQDDTARAEDECLTEIKFYCPPNAPTGADDERKESERAEEAVNEFHEALVRKTQAMGPQDEGIASFADVLFVTPRGRYELEMFSNFLRMHGKTFSYKILYKSINRVFMLPRPDHHVIFAISLDPAIRQGNTTYPYLLMNFDEGDEIELKPNLEKKDLEKYDGALAEEMEGPVHDVVARVFFALTKRKIIAPGSFRSQDNNRAIQCSLKANDGLLFPLGKSFFFIYKPALYIRYDDITSIEFARVGSSSSDQSRTFDLLVNVRGGVHHVFTGMDRDEHEPLLEFLRSKRLNLINANSSKKSSRREIISRSGRRVKTVVDDTEAVDLGIDEEDSDEEDEDFQSEASSEVSDEYEERSQASGSENEMSDGEAHDEEDEDEDEESEEAEPKKKKSKSSSSSSSAVASKRAEDEAHDE